MRIQSMELSRLDFNLWLNKRLIVKKNKKKTFIVRVRLKHHFIVGGGEKY